MNRTRLTQSFIQLLMLGHLVLGGSVIAGPTDGQDPGQVAKEREALRRQINEINQQITAQEAKQAQASDALKASERAISIAKRELFDLNKQQAAVKNDIKQLDEQISLSETDLDAQRAQLSLILQHSYTAGNLNPWGAMLSGSNASEAERDFHYLGYVSQAQAEQVDQIKQKIQSIQDARSLSTDKQNELSKLIEQQKSTEARLAKDLQLRQNTLNSVANALTEQRKQSSVLQQNERQLTKLIDDLNALIAKRAREERERAEQAKRDAEQRNRQASAPPPTDNSPPKPQSRDSSVSNRAFSALKGKLTLPVDGRITIKFGVTRDGGGTSKGLFIKANESSRVYAVADGEVVYADWLRGFGNLLIIDHGGGYLTIYGNNQALYKQLGEKVKASEVIAVSGNTGGQSENGVYFEIRQQGVPVDPLPWLKNP